jgi:hypothetical protein
MVTVRADQPTLHDPLKAPPWAEVPIGDRRRDKGHGRQESCTVKALTDRAPGGLGFPHAERAIRITRTRTIKGKTSRETAYLIVSLPAEHTQPDQLQDWARLESHIETGCTGSATSPYEKTPTEPAPATALPSPPSCDPPPSDTTAATANPTANRPSCTEPPRFNTSRKVSPWTGHKSPGTVHSMYARQLLP